MKKILACASLFFAVATASAQGALEQNKVQINGGVGLSGFGVPVYLGLETSLLEQRLLIVLKK